MASTYFLPGFLLTSAEYTEASEWQQIELPEKKKNEKRRFNVRCSAHQDQFIYYLR